MDIAAATREAQLQPIVQQFTSLLNRGSGGVFANQVDELIANEDKRLVISLDTLREEDPELASQLLIHPIEYLPAFDKALQDLAVELNPVFRKDARALSELHVAVDGSFGHRRVGPRELSSTLVGQLICLQGIVTRCTSVRPKLIRSVQFCPNTKKFHEQYYKDAVSVANFVTLSSLMPAGGSYKMKDADENPLEMEFGMSWFSDSQRITVQEMPESAPPGQLPRSVDVILDGDLVDNAKPGDRISVVGIFRAVGGANMVSGSGVFRTLVVANFVKQTSKNSLAGLKITPQDVSNIRKLASQRSAFDILSRSMAPSIYGFSEIKKSLVLLLLGGAEKNLSSGTHLRGDINLLMVGDPSTAKSQLLRFVLKTAPLAISTTGRGSSGVGLTAAVSSDPDTGERHLEAGAMVLADRGVVCIDEFDKMSDEDRVAIHEVMEQQTVTIAKAGIHASLNARCSVVAAANPLYGSYDRSKKPHENIALPDSLLSRFDLLFIVLDHVSPDNDRAVADHVLRAHQLLPNGSEFDQFHDRSSSAEPNVSEDGSSPVYERMAARLYNSTDNDTQGASRNHRVLNVEFVKKYIQYAKSRVKPELNTDAAEYIARKYSELRGLQSQLTLPITARSLETLIRLATSHAKLRLSATVEKKDAAVAVGILKVSLGAQTDLQDEADESKKRKRADRRREKEALTEQDKDSEKSPEDAMEIEAPKRAGKQPRLKKPKDDSETEEEDDEVVGSSKTPPVRSRRSKSRGESAEELAQKEQSAEEVEEEDENEASSAEKVTDLDEAIEIVKRELSNLMGRHTPVCSKKALAEVVLKTLETPLSSEALFEEVLRTLTDREMLVITDDQIFRV